MVDLLNTRMTELYDVSSGKWFPIDSINVKQGDIIRMFESDMTPVVSDGQHIMIAQSDMTINDDGVFVLECCDWDYEL